MATLDVRRTIASGEEPFEMIMATVASLPPDEQLVIVAPFEPVPLEGVLQGQGFNYEAIQMAEDHWQVTFWRETP